jgi:hypothetical protein
MARKKKIETVLEETVEEVVEVKKPKKSTKVAKSLDDLVVEDFDKLCSEDEAKKIIQLIGDYSFEEDQTERRRCVAIAFGNWRHGAEFDPSVGTKQNFEEHNFNKCKTILEKVTGE